MQTNTSIDALDTPKRPSWLLLSFGATFLLFAGAGTFLGGIIHAGLKDAIDNYGALNREFWNGFVRVAGHSLMFLALAAAMVSEVRAVFRTSVAIAAYQAKLWRQARRLAVVCMGLSFLSSFTITYIPGCYNPVFDVSLIVAFLLLCYVSSTHAKWLSLLQGHEGKHSKLE